jgi:hypothetical protein
MALDSNLPRRCIPGGREKTFDAFVAAGQHIFQGSDVMICAGYAKVSTGSPTNLQGSGYTAMTEADNTLGANGALSVTLVTGRVEAYTNDSGTPLVAADFGKKVRAIDDDTVGLAGNGPVNGVFRGFVDGSDEALVWVEKQETLLIAAGEIPADILGAGLGLDANGKIVHTATATQMPTLQTLAAATALVIASTAKLIKIASDSGAVTLTHALPAGVAGQQVIIQGTSDTNVPTITAGLNVKLVDGVSLALANYANLIIHYDGSTWVEDSRAAGHA